jgi:hypothetical protein
MFGVRLVSFLALCALPGIAAGQAWADAVRAGDYRKAAELLHPIVIGQALSMTSTDPAPARQLASLYAQGLGVAPDPIASCALAQTADMTTLMAHPPEDIFAYKARLEESQQFVRQHCEHLTDAEREAASRSMGCFAFGMPEASLPLGTRTARVGRAGIHLVGTLDDKGDSLTGCPQLIARVRSVTLAPPPDAAPGVKARDFVELLAWQVGQDPATSALTYLLQWQMYERRGEKLAIVAMEEFGTTSSWPSPALPPDFDARFTIEMIRSGHVRWRLDGAPPKRGWIMLPEGTAQ